MGHPAPIAPASPTRGGRVATPRWHDRLVRRPRPRRPSTVNCTDMNDRIVILGAVPTGLGAAHRLAELGHSEWEIYERADHVGGLASSYRDAHGFIWDHGGHVMFSHYSYFDDLVEKMLRGDYDQHMREYLGIDDEMYEKLMGKKAG